MDPCFPYSVWNFPSMLCRWQQIYEPNPDHEQTFLLSRVKRAYTLIFEGPEVDAWLEKKSSMDLTCTNYFKSIPLCFGRSSTCRSLAVSPRWGEWDLPMKFSKLFHNIKENAGQFFHWNSILTAFPDPQNLVPLSL